MPPLERRRPRPPGNPKLTDLWNRILEQARTCLPEQTFATWLTSARPRSLEDGVLHVSAPSRFHAEWLEDKYGAMLQDIATDTLGLAVELRFSFGPADAAPAAGPEVDVAVTPVTPEEAAPPAAAPYAPAEENGAVVTGTIRRRYTFDRFIVGESNRLAQAASRAVAERRARTYNPLFLYGGTGLGKTHLMHAIAHETLRASAGRRVCYITAEDFVNELVTAIYKHRTDAFRARYRSYDLLLMDDVQFLRSKEHTQEEFFHTFNVLYGGRRQIVLTSDRHPKDLKGLEERLVSRFEWGLVADVGAPDYETRVAILRKKAEEHEIPLVPNVLEMIARACKSSVREMEGALIKLLALSSVTRAPVSAELARKALWDAGMDAPRMLCAETIRDEVAGEWSVTAAELESRRRARRVVVPRQVAMYLMREMLGMPLAGIGAAFGGRDHSTVIHSVRTVKARLGESEEFRERVGDVRRRLEPEP